MLHSGGVAGQPSGAGQEAGQASIVGGAAERNNSVAALIGNTLHANLIHSCTTIALGRHLCTPFNTSSTLFEGEFIIVLQCI